MKLADNLIQTIAETSWTASQAVTAAVLARHYKRIIAHTVNINSSVIMPLHKINYFDDNALEESLA